MRKPSGAGVTVMVSPLSTFMAANTSLGSVTPTELPIWISLSLKCMTGSVPTLVRMERYNKRIIPARRRVFRRDCHFEAVEIVGADDLAAQARVRLDRERHVEHVDLGVRRLGQLHEPA